MRILSIDATSDFGSMALLEDLHLVEEVVLHSTDGFAHLLFDHLDKMLHRHGWRLQDLDRIAAAAGPGSFTGVRVGLTTAKGLGEVLGKPVVPVSNLQAVASFGGHPLRAALLDARRGDIYGAVYDSSGSIVQDEVVMKFPAWLESLPSGGIEFVSPTAGIFAPMLAGTRWENAPLTESPRHLAAAVGRLALTAAALDPIAVDANYVRRSDAELFWKEA